MNKIMCIYQILNTKTNKKYIGSTITGFAWRKKTHLLDLKNQKHHNRWLQSDYNLWGDAVLEFSILEEFVDKFSAISREQFWIDKLNPEYNVIRFDIKSHIGVKRSEETRRKQSLAQIGKKHTEETKEKIRRLTTGVKQSQSTLEKRRNTMKSSAAFQKMLISKERLDKIKATRMRNGGYIVSDETRRKISETLKSKHLQSATSIKIQKYDLDGNFICEYPSFKKAERDNMLYKGALYQNITLLKKEKYKNFIWRLVN